MTGEPQMPLGEILERSLWARTGVLTMIGKMMEPQRKSSTNAMPSSRIAKMALGWHEAQTQRIIPRATTFQSQPKGRIGPVQ